MQQKQHIKIYLGEIKAWICKETNFEHFSLTIHSNIEGLKAEQIAIQQHVTFNGL